jgi:hypothetical protein
MTAVRSVWAFGIGLLLAVSCWWLAQVMLSTTAGRDIADIASQGLRVLLLSQLMLTGLAAPWLLVTTRTLPTIGVLVALLLIPLPLHLLLGLAASVTLPAAAIVGAELLVWTLACMAAAALIARTPLRRIAPQAIALFQVGMLVLVWRQGHSWIDWAGLP